MANLPRHTVLESNQKFTIKNNLLSTFKRYLKIVNSFHGPLLVRRVNSNEVKYNDCI